MANEKQSDVYAESPMSYSGKNWWQIAKHVFARIGEDNLGLISAGVAFYFLLAVFPMLTALVSAYGLFVDSGDLRSHVAAIAEILPPAGREIILKHLGRIVEGSSTALTAGAIGSFLLAVWSASKGAQALITACNITYQEKRKRALWRAILMRMTLTLCAVLLVVVALGLIAVLPILLEQIGLKKVLEDWITFLSWPLLALLFNFALAALYRYAPHRRNPKWRWVSGGSVLATVLWIIASGLFSYYVTSFAKYNETYGSLGGVVILLMWLYLSAFVILLGAEFNSVTEHHTTADSTEGPEKARGQRGAYVADTLPDE